MMLGRTLTRVGRPRIALVVGLLLTTGCGGGGEQPAQDSVAAPAVVGPMDSLAAIPHLSGETSLLPQGAPDALGEFRLAGHEPFWSVRVAATGLTYTTPDYQPGIAFPSVAPEVSGKTLRWVAITAAPESHTLDVTLEEMPCEDSMVEKMWTHSAKVIFDGTRLTGCGERIGR